MTDKKETENRFAHIPPSQAKQLASRLQRGEFLSAEEIAHFIRSDPPDGWPEKLVVHISGLLDGDVKRPRGRTPDRMKAINDARMQMFYPAVLKCLTGDADFPSAFCDAVLETADGYDHTYARHDKAAAITSLLVFGHDGHAKIIMNRLSSRKT